MCDAPLTTLAVFRDSIALKQSEHIFEYSSSPSNDQILIEISLHSTLTHIQHSQQALMNTDILMFHFVFHKYADARCLGYRSLIVA